MTTQRKSPMDHPVVVTFLILAVIAAMSLAAEVLKPLALAVLLSFALAPLVGFFERRRILRAAAVLLSIALVAREICRGIHRTIRGRFEPTGFALSAPRNRLLAMLALRRAATPPRSGESSNASQRATEGAD